MHEPRSVGMVPLATLQPSAIAGVKIVGRPVLEVATGKRMHLVVLHLPEGFVHPMHMHPETESMGYVVSGRLEMVVGGKKFTLGPGDVWYHPQRVEHTTTALETTIAIEAHAPLREDLLR